MSTVTTNDQHYTDIANAIRGKNGGTALYPPAAMAAAIAALSTGAQTATGTVTLAAAQRPYTVSGLPFTPKLVIFINTAPSQWEYRRLCYVTSYGQSLDAYGDWEAEQCCFTYGSGQYSISFGSNSFTVNSRTSMWQVWADTYTWIAVA